MKSILNQWGWKAGFFGEDKGLISCGKYSIDHFKLGVLTTFDIDILAVIKFLI